MQIVRVGHYMGLLFLEAQVRLSTIFSFFLGDGCLATTKHYPYTNFMQISSVMPKLYNSCQIQLMPKLF
jgi:hypothetical protein